MMWPGRGFMLCHPRRPQEAGKWSVWGVWREFHRDEEMGPELPLAGEEMQLVGRRCLAGTLVGNGGGLPHLCSVKKATAQGSSGAAAPWTEEARINACSRRTKHRG